DQRIGDRRAARRGADERIRELHLAHGPSIAGAMQPHSYGFRGGPSLACAEMETFGGSFAQAWRLLAGIDPQLVEIVARSLAVSGGACAIACTLGLAAGAWLGVARFAG